MLVPGSGDRQAPGQGRARTSAARRVTAAGTRGTRHRATPRPGVGDPRIGPYRTESECKDALLDVLGRIGQGDHVDDRRTTFGEYLTRRLRWWESEAELKPSTLASYREAVELYFRPGPRPRPTGRPARSPFPRPVRGDAADQPTRPGCRHGRPAAPSARVPAASATASAFPRGRCRRPGSSGFTRLASARCPMQCRTRSRTTRPRASSPAASAVPESAARCCGPPRGSSAGSETGEIPAPVMVWTAAQCGAFLDSLEASTEPLRKAERLYALFHVAAYCGLRRSELAGLAWSDLDLTGAGCTSARRRSTTRWTPPRARTPTARSPSTREPSPCSGRGARLSSPSGWPGTAPGPTPAGYSPARTALRCGRPGSACASGHSPPGPGCRRSAFMIFGTATATMLLAAGQPIKVISEILGHATSAFTADVYTEVAEELADAAAAAIAAYIPRRERAPEI